MVEKGESMENVLLEEIETYWDKRAKGYSKVNQEELSNGQKEIWLCEIQEKIEENYPNRCRADISILDVGTGPGFFAIILAQAGYHVTAVDYTKTMLEQAKKNAGELAKDITFLQMDAQDLTFEQDTFDVVISRNLTWVLEKPDKAYVSWLRVLKRNGLMLNFDANWYGYLYDEEKYQGYKQDRAKVEEQGVEDYYIGTDIEAMEKIARQVPLSNRIRPKWDIGILNELQVAKIKTDLSVWEKVWSLEEKINGASTPMFMIEVVK